MSLKQAVKRFAQALASQGMVSGFDCQVRDFVLQETELAPCIMRPADDEVAEFGPQLLIASHPLPHLGAVFDTGPCGGHQLGGDSCPASTCEGAPFQPARRSKTGSSAVSRLIWRLMALYVPVLFLGCCLSTCLPQEKAASSSARN